jgi:catechol 2,3-dioxygenase-like lactoylglutathione lyase family enzyme
MSRGQMHHLDLTVQDLERSAPFYESVLGFMGYRRTKVGDGWIDWDLALGDGTDCSIAIRQAHRERAHDRYTMPSCRRSAPRSSMRRPTIRSTGRATTPSSSPIRTG